MPGGMDMGFLAKLLQMNPEGIGSMASMAAMKAPPPQIGPGPGGVLAPGAFAGIMDPTIGQVPQGVQSPLSMMGGAIPQSAAQAPGVNPQNNPGLSAQQGYMLGQQMNQPPLQFPGAASFGRPGAVQMNQLGAPSASGQRPSLAQLLGR